jgi:fructuronate reductase
MGTMADALHAGRSLARLAVPIAAWMHFVRARARDGIDIVDPLAAQLAALGRQQTGAATHDLPLFLALPGVFPAALTREARFTRAMSDAYDLIASRGALAAASAATAGAAE